MPLWVEREKARPGQESVRLDFALHGKESMVGDDKDVGRIGESRVAVRREDISDPRVNACHHGERFRAPGSVLMLDLIEQFEVDQKQVGLVFSQQVSGELSDGRVAVLPGRRRSQIHGGF